MLATSFGPFISQLMASSSRGRTTPKSKESGSFYLQAHVSLRLRLMASSSRGVTLLC